MTTFYRVARRRITYREHWRACGDSFTFAVAALAKMLHVARVSSKIVPRLDSLLSVDETQIPRGLAKRCRDVVDECSSWGIQLQFYYRYPSTGDKDPFWTAAMLSQDGLVVAVLSFPESMWPQTTFTCLSRVADGAILGSSDMPHVLDNPPDFDVVYLSDCWAEDIMAEQYRRIKSGRRPVISLEKEDVPRIIIDVNNRTVDYQVSRGVFVAIRPVGLQPPGANT